MPPFRQVNVGIPQSVMDTKTVCETDPGKFKVNAVSDGAQLTQFFWVLTQESEKLAQVSCGGIAYVRGFHLIEKKAGKWLWSTYWWDPDFPSTSAYSLKRDVPNEPWANYAMQAQLQSDGPYRPMYNPWKPAADEPPGSNCQVCHSGAALPMRPSQTTAPPLPLPATSLFFDFIYAGPMLNAGN
jgi:hypothetical protein